MNSRRNFLRTLGLAAASFAILPSATTYKRNWVRTECLWKPNPAYVDAPYEIWWAVWDREKGGDTGVRFVSPSRVPPHNVGTQKMPYLIFKRNPELTSAEGVV